MIYVNECVRRDPWVQPFLAEPREISGLRRALRLRLTLWGLSELFEPAQTCVAELASNVIRHVGVGTAASLTMAMRDAYLRIEVRDPDPRALPTLIDSTSDSESGRGMTLVDAASNHRWGVVLCGDSKVVWCELATEPVASLGCAKGPRVARAEEHLVLYGGVRPGWIPGSRLGVAVAEGVAIDLIADLLHWLRAHGCDPDEALDRAQMHFESESGAVS